MKCLLIYISLLGILTAKAQQSPVAVGDMVRVVSGSTTTFDYLHLNDTDPDGDSLEMVPTNGVEYIAGSGFTGITNLTYTVGDGTLQSVGTVTVVVNAPIDAEVARDQILAGVTNIASGEDSGKLALFGPTAYAVNGFAGEGEVDPMVGIASWGSGKVIAMPDHQMLDVNVYGGLGDTAQFVFNGLGWLSGSTSKDIRIVTYHSAHRDWLLAQGYTDVVDCSESSLASDIVGADVFFAAWMGSSEPVANLDAIGDFVKAGGGLFICDYGNGYEDFWWNSKTRPEAPGNVLLREAGIGFCDGGHRVSGAIDASNRSTMKVGLETALAMLVDSTGYTTDELNQGGELLVRTAEVLPLDDIFFARRGLVFFDRVSLINPTPTTPVSDGFEQSLLAQEADILSRIPATEVVAHRTANAVYGTLSPDAPRVTGTVSINANRSRWQATGFYAPPGELVTVTLPAVLVDQGYRIRVNAHTDDITPRGSWERMPYVHRYFEITNSTMQVANAFGGSIFIDLRGGAFDNSPPALGLLDVTVSGAVKQPWFDLDQHTDADWNTSLRNQPGLFAVFVSTNHVVTVPKDHVESVDLTEPTRLMTWWNSVVQLEDELVNYLGPRTGSELANVDVQIRAGGAHSGFPFQAYEKHWGNLVNIDKLSIQGSWGDFHELGHNHQRGWWTFDGDGEVTCNVFSAYCLRTLASDPDPGGWGWTVDPVAVIQKATTTLQSTNYVGTASLSGRLSFWVQLADGFGWEAYKHVYGSYELDNANHPENLPSGNQEKMEQWLVRFSNQVGYDLSEFMIDTWGFPIAPERVAQVSHLPSWMPVMGAVPDAIIPINKAHIIDISGHTYSMDGVADLVGVSSPSNGRLVDNSDGTWTYEPDYDFSGTENIVYTLRSSAGNTQTFTNRISVSRQGAYRETWRNISGSSVSDLTGTPSYPNQPDESEGVDSLSVPYGFGDSYGVRIRALLLPPETGNYTFWTASDDASEVWLSPDENPESGVRIAYVDDWTSELEWTQDPSQQSDPIPLIAGQKYYIEIFLKEGGGGDHLNIAWKLPSGTTTNVISGEALEFPPHVYAEAENARIWAGRHGLAGGDLDEGIDPDGDGYSNQQEFDAGTNPNNRADFLHLSLNADVWLEWGAVSGKTYRVEYRNGFSDPEGWRVLVERMATQQIEIADPDSGTQRVRIYRLIANPLP